MWNTVVGKSKKEEFKKRISDVTRYEGNDSQEVDLDENREIDTERQVSKDDSIKEMEDTGER